MANNEQQPTSWWGEYTFPINQTNCWEIGPLTMFVHRLEKEWNVSYKRNDGNGDTTSWQYHPDAALPSNGFETKRYVFAGTDETLHITPLLADRSVVIRPETPLHVPAGQETTLFVSTPLWLQLKVHEPAVKLLGIAITRPSDTWFGPSTMEGELCYASSTLGRLSLVDFPHLPHRAITPVIIRNNSDEMFQLEQLNLPVSYLSLYSSLEQCLWTESVTMVREPDISAASLQIGENAPEQAVNAVLISEPRKKTESRSFISKISDLFG
jgi:hypothetical protein